MPKEPVARPESNVVMVEWPVEVMERLVYPDKKSLSMAMRWCVVDVRGQIIRHFSSKEDATVRANIINARIRELNNPQKKTVVDIPF